MDHCLERCRRRAGRLQHVGQPGADAGRWILWRSKRLGYPEGAGRVVDEQQIGKGAADVHTSAQSRTGGLRAIWLVHEA